MIYALQQHTMSTGATSAVPFSAGLRFDRKAINGSPGKDTSPEIRHGIHHEEPPAADQTTGWVKHHRIESEEERLMRRAAEVRHCIEVELAPRQEEVDCVLRNRRRQLVELRRLLPSERFLNFRQRCARWRDELRLFEELVVQALMREAVGSAVRGGEVMDPARWRKSNQWPNIRNFLQLELHLCLAFEGNFSAGVTSSEQLKGGTAAIHQHLAALWRDHQDKILTHDFLDSYYRLRDVVEGWGSGWYARPSCVDAGDNIRTTAHSKSGYAASPSRACPFATWETLSPAERLNGYSTMCPRHLTEEVVHSLETLLATHFADVWRHVHTVIDSRDNWSST
ncbi:hypothetical protein JKF63_00733 [Porcisia hertigi]|uniref:Uncharacterized protein n=1 Tax=Porcisia hertigi TaxID=2761500 RepID=A0A836KYL3_9TRYP|nr:hypothetical protein JKF63_00733 [Porcisia hertigi]